MELSAVLLARVFVLIESYDLNPFGKAFYPDLIRAVADRYGFQRFPQKFEDLDESKGVEFSMGKTSQLVIDRIVILSNGISLDTRVSTHVSEAILNEVLSWLSSEHGLHYSPEMIQGKTYASHITFQSDAPLLSFHPSLNAIAGRVSGTVSDNIRLPLRYGVSSVTVAVDPGTLVAPTAPFTLERRSGIPFAQRKYFSAAPVHTDEHISMLRDYEDYTLAATH